MQQAKAGIAVALVAAVATIGLATPSTAVTNHTVTINLTGTTCDANTIATPNVSALQVAPDDVITVTVTNNVNNGAAVTCGVLLTTEPDGGNLTGWVSDPNGFATDLSNLAGAGATRPNTTPFVLIYAAGSVNTALRVIDQPSNIFNSIVTIRVVEGTQAGQSPPDLLQQYAIGPDDECGSVPDGVQLFNVVGAGGWGKSWAQWPNDGTGGFVCTRNVGYQSSTGTWVPRAT